MFFQKNHKSHEIMIFMSRWEGKIFFGHKSHDFMTFSKKNALDEECGPYMFYMLFLVEKPSF